MWTWRIQATRDLVGLERLRDVYTSSAERITPSDIYPSAFQRLRQLPGNDRTASRQLSDGHGRG